MLVRSAIAVIIFVTLAWITGGANVGHERAHATAKPSRTPDGLQAFFDYYCVQCHGGERPKGGVRLDAEAPLAADVQPLRMLLEVIVDGQMPPRDAERRPQPEQREAAAEAVRGRLAAAELAVKRPALRRLTRREYRYIVNDLLGIDFDRTSLLPPDNAGEGFDNTAAGLLLGPDAMTQYMEAASEVVAMAIDPISPPVRTLHFERGNEFYSGGELKDLAQEQGGVLLDQQGASFYPKFEVRVAGVYEITLEGNFELTRHKAGMRGSERIEMGEFEALPIHARIGMQRPWREPELPSFPVLEPHKPLHVRIEPNQYINIIYRRTHKRASVVGGEYDLATRFHLRRLTVRGPFEPEWPPPSHARVFGELSADADDTAVNAAIDRLAFRLFARPVEAADMAAYHALAHRERETGANAYAAVQAALRAMLCSARFIYLDSGEGPSLDGHAVAARLARFLWSTAPDQALLDDAVSDGLLDPDVRRLHARRMLGDDRSDRFVESFVRQWLDLDKLSGIAVHDAYNIKLERLVDAMSREPIEFTRLLIADNLSILNFIDSDFVVINDMLHSYYGLRTGRIRDGFTRVDLPEDERARRGGLLTQAAFAMLTSDGTHTSPILRGVWVLENLYGLPMAQPESVPALQTPDRDDPTTVVALIARHRADPSCARCHDRIDPIGVSLENVGLDSRWRETYRMPVLVTETFERNGKTEQRDLWELREFAPIEARGTLVDGGSIDGLPGLRAVLLNDRDRIARAFVERLFTYAMGREPTLADGLHIEALLESTRSTDHPLRDLIVELIASDAFISH